MDLNQSIDAGSTTSPGHIEVKGQTTIQITDSVPKGMSNHKISMKYYVGEVRCGNGDAKLQGIKATILCFQGEGEVAKDIHDCLKCVSHPYVFRTLGYGRGLNSFSGYQFLALPFFDLTFKDYIKEKWRFVEMGRFNMEFIKIIGDIVRAILALHNAGFCCKKLESHHIALVKQHNSKRAKIWIFKKCTSDSDKDHDWVNLGNLLSSTGHQGIEAQDLYNNLTNGNLKGLDVLKHSALLTVRQKFRNVLIFEFYTKVHWKEGKVSAETSEQQIVQPPSWLDEKFDWKLNKPGWMFAKALSNPPKTYRGFSTNLRHLVEHEVDFLPPEMSQHIPFKDRDMGVTEIDLEQQIQKAWGQEFLKLQNFVRTNNLTY